MEKRILDKYNIIASKIKGDVEIISSPEDFVPLYIIRMPELERGTLILLDKIKEILVTVVKIKVTELTDPKSLEELKERFYLKSLELIEQYLPGTPIEKKEVLAGTVLHEMLGLGKIEMLLADGNLEEIVVNSSKEPVWVYHKKHGWLKTNIIIPTEIQIQNYAASIGRRIGRQITTLDPLLDAHLITGDRVNATLFPISTIGNTLTIRLFRRKPWTITDFIINKTISPELTAILWLGVQYEMSMLISGGTASGKTSFLGAIMPFIQTNQRIVSIEDTRELSLPQFLHWVPLTTREPNPEGKGAVEMLDLLVNSLRMRPDRIVVGEIRRQAQAEVLFEAMHTGHSVYATLHADTVEQTYRRLINPPINVPETLLEALDLIIAMYRDRRSGIRRIFQLAEIVPPSGRVTKGVTLRVLYKWNVKDDKIEKFQESYRFIQKLQMHTGMSNTELEKDKNDKIKILNWMVENHVNMVNGVGKVVAEYYRDPEYVLNIVEKKAKAETLIPKNFLVD
jgi:flagellar protein FlaI